MLKDILKKAYFKFIKIKIVHSIPGRLRLFIPYLDKLPNNAKKYEDYVSSIIKLKKGINKIEYSYITSKILIEYDKDKLDDKKIISWLEKIWNIILENQSIYEGLSVDEIEANVSNFYNMLREKLTEKE